MQIYVAKNGQQYGPYSEQDVAGYLTSGQFSQSDLAWREGCSDWVPLAQLVSRPGGNMPPGMPPASGNPALGTASFVIGLVGIVFWIVILAAAAYGVTHGRDSKSGFMISVGLLLFAGLGVNIVAAILGIIAVNKAGYKKALSIIGIAINSVEFIGILLLMLVGMASK
jgi:hypothetical protein